MGGGAHPQGRGTGGGRIALGEYTPPNARLPGCTGCRDRGRRGGAERAHRGESQWPTTIDWMASIGSQEGIRAADVRAFGLRPAFAVRNYHPLMHFERLCTEFRQSSSAEALERCCYEVV